MDRHISKPNSKSFYMVNKLSTSRLAGIPLPLIVFATVLGALFLFLAAPRIMAHDTLPVADQIIHACVDSHGNIVITDPNADGGSKDKGSKDKGSKDNDGCKKKELALDWNAIGPQGPQGDPGVDGTNGTNGTDGIDGTNGTDGIDGTNGTNGTNGTDGINGTNGTDGIDGTNGTDGAPSQYPVSMAMGKASYANATVSSITVNGQQVQGPVAPNTNVTIKFNWSIGSAGSIIQQVVVGFAGESFSRCIHSGTGAASGTASITLPTPSTTGPAVFNVIRTWQYNCTDTHPHQHPIPGGNSWIGVPGVPGFGAYMAVVAVK